MVSCVVSSCRNCSGKISKIKDGITFHRYRFPRDKTRRKQWELAVNREADWRATSSSAVCSEHFAASCLYLTENGFRKLSVDAIPSINISPCQVQEPTICQVPPVDIDPTDSDQVVQLKHKVRRLEIIAESRKRRLRQMWQRKKSLRKKIEQMKCLVKHLIKHKQAKTGDR